MRILVADDDSALLDVMRHSLGKLGHEVDTVTDGQEALELLKREQIHLVITDWGMPRMDGVELCRRVRAEVPYEVYIIMLTGRSNSVVHMDSLSAGADDYVFKPFGVATLVAAIRVAEHILSLSASQARKAV